MELLVGAEEKSRRREHVGIGLRSRRSRGATTRRACRRGRRAAGGERLPMALGIRPGRTSRRGPGRRRERHRRLELRVIAAAGALKGVGPAMVEDIFAHRMRFEIAGKDRGRPAVGAVEDEMLAEPAGLSRRARPIPRATTGSRAKRTGCWLARSRHAGTGRRSRRPKPLSHWPQSRSRRHRYSLALPRVPDWRTHPNRSGGCRGARNKRGSAHRIRSWRSRSGSCFTLGDTKVKLLSAKLKVAVVRNRCCRKAKDKQ